MLILCRPKHSELGWWFCVWVRVVWILLILCSVAFFNIVLLIPLALKPHAQAFPLSPLLGAGFPHKPTVRSLVCWIFKKWLSGPYVWKGEEEAGVGRRRRRAVIQAHRLMGHRLECRPWGGLLELFWIGLRCPDLFIPTWSVTGCTTPREGHELWHGCCLQQRPPLKRSKAAGCLLTVHPAAQKPGHHVLQWKGAWVVSCIVSPCISMMTKFIPTKL